MLAIDYKMAQSLGHSFGIADDLIKQKQIILLYENGQDVIAEEVLVQVN